MICPYCGYEYDDTELKCPFCATENTGQAREQQRIVIRSLEEETEDIRRMPNEMLRQTNQKAFKVFTLVLAAVIFTTILVVIGTFAFQAFHESSTKRNLDKLEEYVLENDYDSILNLMDESDFYDSAYDKYQEIAYTYRSMTYLEDDLKWFYESREDSYSTQETVTTYLAFAIADCMNTLSTGRDYIDDNLILGNENALENICSQAENTLTLTFHLTDEEIQELLDMEVYYYDSDNVLPYAKLALDRME